MLRCGDGSLYTGMTNDLEKRVARHQAGKGAAYTRSRLPVALVFHRVAEDRSEALKAEAAMKRLSRREKLALLDEAAASVASRKPRRGKSVAKAKRPR